MSEELKQICKAHELDCGDGSFAHIIKQIYYNWDMDMLQELMNDIMTAETEKGEVIFDV